MAQEALNGLLQYLVGALSYDNRVWLAQHLVESPSEESVASYTMAEINERLDESEQQIAAGHILSHEQVMHDLRDLA